MEREIRRGRLFSTWLTLWVLVNLTEEVKTEGSQRDTIKDKNRGHEEYTPQTATDYQEAEYGEDYMMGMRQGENVNNTFWLVLAKSIE